MPRKSVVMHVAVFVALAIAAGALIHVAASESASAAAPDTASVKIAAEDVFTKLQPCEVPGLAERLLGQDSSTKVFAGIFSSDLGRETMANATIFVYVTAGQGVVRVGKSSQHIAAGDFIELPKGIPHALSPVEGTMRAIYFENRDVKEVSR